MKSLDGCVKMGCHDARAFHPFGGACRKCDCKEYKAVVRL